MSRSYDGAANMAGAYSGLHVHFENDATDSIFTHCHAHVLNLLTADIISCCFDRQHLFAYCEKNSGFLPAFV